MSELHDGVHISNKEVAVQPNFAIHNINVENEVSFSLLKPGYKDINNRFES